MTSVEIVGCKVWITYKYWLNLSDGTRKEDVLRQDIWILGENESCYLIGWYGKTTNQTIYKSNVIKIELISAPQHQYLIRDAYLFGKGEHFCLATKAAEVKPEHINYFDGSTVIIKYITNFHNGHRYVPHEEKVTGRVIDTTDDFYGYKVELEDKVVQVILFDKIVSIGHVLR